MNYFLNGKPYTFDEMKHFINEHTDISLQKPGRVREALQMAELPDSSRVLDIGSHIGNALRDVATAFPNIRTLAGVECNETAYAIAREFTKDPRISFYLHDCKALPFEEESFDRVLCFEVLEHVRDVDFFLKETNRVLQEGGLLVLSVPNATWWRNIMKDIFINTGGYAKTIESWPSFTPDQRDHVNNYNFIHLYRILNLNGFFLKEIAYLDQNYPILCKIPGLKKLSSTLLLSVYKHAETEC